MTYIRYLRATVAIISISGCSGAYAQTVSEQPSAATAAEQQSSSTQDSAIETVVVSAERRPEKLQNTAAAINVVSGATLANLHVDTVTNLTSLVPGLKIDGNQRDELRLGLRGAFASATSPGSGQAVGLYIDGVPYVHTSDLGNNLFGIEQVEVLRGPQGTLYGQNVIGGLVNIVTRDPGDQLNVDAKASYSSFNRVDLGAYVGGPLSDTLTGSISFNTSHSDGWQRNLVTGNLLDQLNTWSVRGKFVWRPTAALTVKFIQDFSSNTTYGIQRAIVYGTPSNFTVPSDWKETTLAQDGRYDSYGENSALLADYDLGWGTLSSITSYQHNRPHVIDAPQITSPVAYEVDDRRNNSDTFTQEFRLAGTARHLHWQVGTFILDDYAAQYQQYNVHTSPDTFLNTLGITDYVVNEDFKVHSTSYSIFSELSYDVTDVLGVTLGGRYNWDKKQSNFHDYGDVSAIVGVLSQAPFTLEQSASWTEFTPKATVDAKWENVGPFNNLLFYATISKGYEAGNFFAGPTVAGATGTVPPEIAWSYEGGFKSSFLNHLATLNATVFKVNYTNLQTLSFSGTGASNGNNAIASTDAKAWGVEVGATLMPIAGLTLSADYNYLNTRIAAGAEAPDGSDVSGNQLPESPPWTYNFAASYVRDLSDDLVMRFTTAYSSKGPVFYDVRNIRTSPFPSVMELSKQKNLDAEIALIRGGWEVSVWGKNLTDRESLIRAYDGARALDLSAADFKAGGDIIDGTLTVPRSIGVTLRYTY